MKGATLILIGILCILFVQAARAGQNSNSGSPAPAARVLPQMHPAVEPFNAIRQNAFYTATPIDANATCGNCHDTGYITSHSTHHFMEQPDWATADVSVTCFDCHVPDQSGWVAENMDMYGKIAAQTAGIRKASNQVCAKCHGVVQSDALSIPDDYTTQIRDESGYLTYDLTRLTGAFFSDLPFSKSTMNLKNKSELQFAADVHAQRLIGCGDCHHTANNPAKSSPKGNQLRHLKKDPRVASFSDYLKTPNHMLAMPQCTDCHNAMATHDFLPYKKAHLDVLDCQSCHIPKVYGPMVSGIDETVLTESGAPFIEYSEDFSSDAAPNARLISGVSPYLLLHQDPQGKRKIGAYNLVANWYWLDDATGKRVPSAALKQAYLNPDQSGYRDEVVAVFDQNHNGHVEPNELQIRSASQSKAIARLLQQSGVARPRIQGVVDAHPIVHGIRNKSGVTAQCDSCHSESGRLNHSIEISKRNPAGAQLSAGKNIAALTNGHLVASSKIQWERQPASAHFYIFGHTRTRWSDMGGFLIFILSLCSVLLHGAYRFATRKSRSVSAAPLKRVYMYSLYERLWHWLMAASVVVLLITGLKIHFPLRFTAGSFPLAVTVHNITAIVLVLNAALSLFFHLASAAIMQFIPQKDGLIQALVKQIEYYTRGIFLGHPHPSEKTPDKKLNPLQQLTYLGLLNVLFPLQVLTGIGIWLNAGWPEMMEVAGGLTIIGPLHNLGSWLFLTFLVVHLYLTTTGHTVLSNISAMVSGYDSIESTAKGGIHD